jgi:RHS repeat-associated protein
MAGETNLVSTPAKPAPGYSGANAYFQPGDSDAELRRKASVLVQDAANRALEEAVTQGFEFTDPLSLTEAINARITLNPVGTTAPEFMARVRGIVRAVLDAQQDELFVKAVELGTAHAIIVAEGETAVQRPSTAADPVVLFNGQYVSSAVDMHIRGAGIDFVLARTYKNQAMYRGPLGYNWDHSYNLWLRLSPNGQIITCATGDLREDRYVRHGIHDYWMPPDGEDAVFNRVDGALVRRAPDGRRDTYEPDPSAPPLVYRVARIDDRFGNYLSFDYEEGTLRRVEVNHPRRFALFIYDDARRLAAVTDHTDRTCRYWYDDSDDLVAVTTPQTARYPDGLTTYFEYASTASSRQLQHNLIRIVDPAGQVHLENEYGIDPLLVSFNRVTRQRQGGGEVRFEYSDVVQQFDFDYAEIERPAYETAVIERNGLVRRHVFNHLGNLLLREEEVLLDGIPTPLRWHSRYNRDGNLVATLTPEGTLSQYLYGRDLFMRLHPNLDEAEFSSAAEVTEEVRRGFGRVQAVVRRSQPVRSGNLNLNRGIWGDIFPDVLAGRRVLDGSGDLVAEDTIVKFEYEPAYGQPRVVSDPRYTNSADPAAFDEHPRYANSLIRYEHGGPPGDPTLFVTAVVRPTPMLPDGTQGTPVVERFTRPDGTPAYDMQGRLLRHVNAVGTTSEYRYFAGPNDPRAGNLRQTIVDPGGLAVTTSYEVDALGRVTATRLPRGVGLADDRFVTQTTYNELDQVVEVVTSAPFAYWTRRLYDRNGMLEREERLATDESGAPLEGGSEVRCFTYDAELSLTSESLGGANLEEHLVTQYQLGPSGERLRTILPAGNQVWHRYDEHLRQVELTIGACSPDAATWRSSYDGDSRPRRQIDARGNVTELRHDPLGRIVYEEDPLGHLTLTSYDKADRAVCVRHFERRLDGFYLLNRAAMEHDELGRTIRTTTSLFEAPLGPIDRADVDDAFLDAAVAGKSLANLTFYDAGGRIERIVDALQRETRYEYDAADRLVRIVDAMGNETRRQYDAHGNVIRTDRLEPIRDPQSGVVTGQRTFAASSTFDELDRMTTSTSGLGNVVQNTYDSRGNLVTRVDPLGNTTHLGYDIYGRRVAIHQELTSTGLGNDPVEQTASTIFEYDRNGNAIAVTDPLGRRTVQRYDQLDRRRVVIYPDQSQTTFEYDPDGFLRNTVDGNGTQKRYIVDAMGRITSVDIDTFSAGLGSEVAGETFQEFRYDGAGRCLMARNDFAQCEFSYNSMGWMVEEASTALPPVVAATRLVVRREFDDVGALGALTYPEGRRIVFARDWLSRATSIRNVTKGLNYPGSAAGLDDYLIADISYIGSQYARYELGNAASTRFSYDREGRVIQIVHDRSSAMALTTQYAYDASARMRFRHDVAPGRDVTEIFSYDSISRIRHQASAVRALFSTVPLEPPQGTLPDPIPPVQQQVDAIIGPLALPNVTTIDYDLTGNRTRTSNAGTDVHYDVNDLDQYDAVDGAGFQYDANGNLRDDGNLKYRFDGGNRLVGASAAGSGQELASYFHDPFGRRIVETENGASRRLLWDGATLVGEYRNDSLFASYVADDGIDRPLHIATQGAEAWYHRDIIGSVRLLTDSSGDVSASYRYSSFGSLEESTGAMYNPVRYAGYRFSEDLGSYDCRARQYHPALGRFLQRDPAGMADGSNLYVYTGNNPLVFSDPLGTARTHAQAMASHPNDADEWVLTDPFDPLGRVARGIMVTENTRLVRRNSATLGVKETDVDPPYERNWLLQGPEWFNRTVQVAIEGGRSAKATARFNSLNENQSKIKAILEMGHGCAACHITTRVWGELGPEAINPENGLPYDWALNMNGYHRWANESARARFFVSSMTAIGMTKMQTNAAFASQWLPANPPKVGRPFSSLDEAFGQGGHTLEVIVRNKNGREIGRWWEASERGIGQLGHTEQKALGRIKLGPDIEIEMRGWHNPCPYSGGCMNTMRHVADEFGTTITYRTPRGTYYFSEGVE